MHHHEPSIRTLQHALRTLYSVSVPSLFYHQRLDIRNLYADLTYSSYLLHRPEHEILTLTFPRECELISHMKNNYGYKMVYDVLPITFSHMTTPTYRISDAVRASMSAPYYFQPFLCPQTGHYLVDGAVISNYPLFVLPKEEHDQTLSILIRTSVEKVIDLMEMGIDELITRPMYIALQEKANIEIKCYDARCIPIMLGEINILDFSFDEETKNKIIAKGKEAVISYFRNQRMEMRSNTRRHSIS